MEGSEGKPYHFQIAYFFNHGFATSFVNIGYLPHHGLGYIAKVPNHPLLIITQPSYYSRLFTKFFTTKVGSDPLPPVERFTQRMQSSPIHGRVWKPHWPWQTWSEGDLIVRNEQTSVSDLATIKEQPRRCSVPKVGN